LIASAQNLASVNAPVYLIGRFHEVALKGGNRWRFVEAVKDNLRAAFADYRLNRIRILGKRLIVELPRDLTESVAQERASLVFGLQNFSLSHLIEPTLDSITAAALAAARRLRDRHRSFRVSARRAEKRFPHNSMEIERSVGAAIVASEGLRVDLTNPDFEVSIEILPEGAFISAGKIAGAGGLPVGVTGRGMMLLSGGIDSPVAAYRMMRRGLRLDFVHFHSYPLVSGASRDKAGELAAHLTRFESRATLILAPFAEIQREIVASAARPLRVVLYRRMMLRIATAIAHRNQAQALVTGESLGQVASQTLENMTVIAQATALPILRPLIGTDKNEIVAEARRLGTFDTSILPDQDCCSLFVPAHPETRARLASVIEAERAFDIERMVDESVNKIEVISLRFPPIAERGRRFA
jgi:thiamine biosynthesis protein ThiI